MKQQAAAVLALVAAFFFQYVKAEQNASIKAANATEGEFHSSEASPLKIADAVVHAVELAEHGSGRLLASLRAATQSAPQSGNPKDAARSEEMLDKIVMLMRALRPLAGRLRTEARSEIEHLRADAAREKSLSEVAESRLATMKRDEDRLQTLFQDEIQKGHKCFQQLTESQRLLNAKMNETDKVLHLRKELEEAHAAVRNATRAAEDQRARMEVEIADSRIESSRVHAQLKAMHEQIAVLTRQNSKLIEAGRSWASRVAEADEELHHFNVTRRAYEVKLAELSDKLGELEEQHEDQVDESKQLESSNEILKEDDKASKATVTKLQKELDVASEDKVHLLDSIRSLIHQNDELKSSGPRQQQPTPAAAVPAVHNTDAAKVQKPVQANDAQEDAGDAAAADWREFDEIAWMGRTAKIDNYLSGLSDEERVAAEAQHEKQRRMYLKAHHHPQTPQLAHYLGGEFHPTPAESKALQAANAAGEKKEGAVAQPKPAPVATPVVDETASVAIPVIDVPAPVAAPVVDETAPVVPAPVATPAANAAPAVKTAVDTKPKPEPVKPITPALHDPRPRHRATNSNQAKKISPQVGAAGAVLRGARHAPKAAARNPKWVEDMKNQSQELEDDAFSDLTEAAKLLASVS